MAVERIKVLNIQEEEPIYVPDGDPPAFIPIHLSVDQSGGIYPGEYLVPASDYEQVEQQLTELREALEAEIERLRAGAYYEGGAAVAERLVNRLSSILDLSGEGG